MVPVALYTVFLLWVVVLMVWDVRTRRLPDHLTLPGVVLIVGWALVVDPWLLLGGVAWFTLYLVTAVVMGGIGGGDIKFALGLGTVAAVGGAVTWLVAVVGASVITLAASGLMLGWGKCGDRIPHGPGMGLATCIPVGLALMM